MPKKRKSTTAPRRVTTLKHEAASRTNIPTAEYEAVLDPVDQNPVQVAFERRNRDLDPQLVWRGKEVPGPAELTAQAPPLFIQEKVHPKVLVDDLARETRRRRAETGDEDGQPDLFADFNGLPIDEARAEFYRHDANWSNRMILGDSLQVMASLAEREGLRGKVQCIYMDPPYGIKFNSNFQWSTTSRDVKDGKAEHISREPEQVKAFRDTWRDGIHSYLTYLRDRLTVARELLAESGSIFVQIGDENVHRVRALMDEMFGDANFVSLISYRSSVPLGATYIPGIMTYIVMYAKSRDSLKFRRLFAERDPSKETRYAFAEDRNGQYTRLTANQRRDIEKVAKSKRLFVVENLNSAGRTESCVFPFTFQERDYKPTRGKSWKTNRAGMNRLVTADRILSPAGNLNYKLYLDDYPVREFTDVWMDTQGASDKTYIVQTPTKVIQRCLLMTTDPGDLVLDPTCGAGTTAYVAEQWGRRWITIDTSRVALALARARVMGARYLYYLLADSAEGRRKECEITHTAPSDEPTQGDVRQGFVYDRVPHVTLESIANNSEIDTIWERWQETLEPLREDLNAQLDRDWEEWQIPRESGDPWPEAAARAWNTLVEALQEENAEDAGGTKRRRSADPATALELLNEALDRHYTLENLPDRPYDPWMPEATESHRLCWEARIARQQEIDASIAARADMEYLYDKPYEDPKRVRVAGPFTVESLSPHRLLAFDEADQLIDRVAERAPAYGSAEDFAAMALGHLATSGVQQAHKADRITFSSIEPWPGERICAEGRYNGGR